MMLSGGQALHWTYCKNVRLMILGTCEGDRLLSGQWTGFTKLTLLRKSPPRGYTWSGSVTDEDSSNVQAQKMQSIYHIDLEDNEFNETMKTRERSWNCMHSLVHKPVLMRRPQLTKNRIN